jgi:polynucleotide 5'-kinase involved in rRNA processing
MSEVSKLKETITILVQGKADLILYGNKSSGKTSLATKILNKV